MRPGGVEFLAPTAQLGEWLRCKLSLEVGALGWIHLRLGEKRFDKGFDVESRSSYDHRLLPDLVSAFDPFVRLARPSGRGVPLLRVGDIDSVMGCARTLPARRLGSSDIEAAIDLSRIRAQNRGIVRLTELQRDRGFAGCGRTTDHSQPIASQSAALPRP